MLEECGLGYETHLLRLNKGDQFSDEFLKISPNAKMPAIVDNDVDGEPVSVFESGAIFVYLAEKTGRFMPSDSLGRKETLEWLFWQAANQGPYAGQLSHFVNYAPKGQASEATPQQAQPLAGPENERQQQQKRQERQELSRRYRAVGAEDDPAAEDPQTVDRSPLV